jgi:hypothetical protein
VALDCAAWDSNRKRQAAVVQDGGVTVTEVPSRTQPRAGAVAQPQDLSLADQVPKRLSGTARRTPGHDRRAVDRPQDSLERSMHTLIFVHGCSQQGRC